ncbi:MAG: hypothetical protein AAB593_00970 [Patescibacteria group bacterium]|mgnify:CR=1 FL=1
MLNTKQFVQIQEIRNGVVILKNGGLRAVLITSSMNFILKSNTEQQGIVSAFKEFLDSIEWPVQIIVNSRQINLDNYIADLDERAQKQENELMRIQISEYSDFIKSLISISNIISKNFYIVVPYSPLNLKKGGILKGLSSNIKTNSYSDSILEEYKNQLWQRVKHIQAGLSRLTLRAEPLNTKELLELYYNFYNPTPKTKKPLNTMNSQ